LIFIESALCIAQIAINKINILKSKCVTPNFAKREGVAIEPAFVIKEITMFLAFNKSVSADLIEKLNKTLQDMKNDGTLEKIYAKYR